MLDDRTPTPPPPTTGPPSHASRPAVAARHSAAACLLALASCATPQAADSADEASTTAATSTAAGVSASDPDATDTVVTGNDDTTAEPPDSGGGLECARDADCLDPDAPACIVGNCVGCYAATDPDSLCTGRSPDLPACGADGACVQCSAENVTACGAATPVCDAADGTCSACTRHEECPGTACDIDTGACFPADCLLVVDADGGGHYADLDSAVQSVAANSSCVLQIHTPADDIEYGTPITIAAGRRIALLGQDELVAGLGVPYNQDRPAVLSVESGAAVYVSRLRLTGGEIVVGAASLWLDRVDARNPWGATVHTVDPQADVTLVNSWIRGGDYELGAVRIDAGHVDGVFTTVLGDGVAVGCAPQATSTIRSSLLISWSSVDAIDCSGIDLSYSALEEQYAGAGNQSLGAAQPLVWFEIDYDAGGIVRLTDASPQLLGVTARWATGDPPWDIDGEPRPTMDGTMTFAGADTRSLRATSSTTIGAHR